MILLPDMRICIGTTEHTLSLQDPYTLDEELITDIYVEYSSYNSYYDHNYPFNAQNNYIRIKNEYGYCVTLSANELEHYIRSTLHNFFRELGRNRVTVGENQRYMWTISNNYSILQYINYLKVQCDRMSYSSPVRIVEDYKERLRVQGRSQGRYLDEDRLRELDEVIDRVDATITSHTTEIDDSISCIDYYSPSSICKKKNKYIHEYNYKPEYIKHYMPGEDESTLLLGAEIEVDCGGESDEHAKKVLEIVCGISKVIEVAEKEYKKIIVPRYEVVKKGERLKLKEGYIKDTIIIQSLINLTPTSTLLSTQYYINNNDEIVLHSYTNANEFLVQYDREVNAKTIYQNSDTYNVKEDKMYCTHDGSLKAGIEFDTMPCTLEYHKNKMRYKEMFAYLDQNGYKAHDTTTCGLHIHADRSYLGKSELKQQLTISKILYILEKFNHEICVIARRNNNYSKFVGKDEVNKSLDKLYNKYSSDKHVALNLKHKDSIEFRCFKGTLKYETFILTLEFVKDIIDYAKSINIEDIELIQWSDLMNTFSDDLKKYYNDRLEKEKNKCDEKKEDSYRTGFFESGAIYWDTSFNTNAECSEVELKKKEIKTLKKKIKNCSNYMERKSLNQELAQLQKELKKLKKNRTT